MRDRKIIDVQVRGRSMKLVGYTRSLELCARMNYETENLDFIDQISPGEVLFDLGACEGRFSVYAALGGIRTYAFEPDELNFAALLENQQINGELTKQFLIPHQLAVGNVTGPGKLKVGQNWAGGHQKVVELSETRDDLNFNFVAEKPIQLVTLDHLIGEQGLPIPDHLKVDIDGSEWAFMEGAKQTLVNPKLRRIIFELSTSDPRFEAILRQLQEYGFREESRHQVPNEPHLFNIIFVREK
jgi:FkbM family methyltransferase